MLNYLGSQSNSLQKWVLLLLFLFPVAGPVVRHWNNFFFLLLTITALIFVIKGKSTILLIKEEKIILWVFTAFFFVFIVSALFNGWGNAQTLELGNELKFLFFVPIYLLIREFKYSKKALLGGVLMSIPTIFIFSVYEYLWVLPGNGMYGLNGAYFHLFLGPITALMLLMVYPAFQLWFANYKYIWIIPIFGFMGLFVIVESQARLAQLTIIGGALVLLLLLMKSIKTKLISTGLIMLLVFGAFQLESIQYRVNKGIAEISQYLDDYKNVNSAIHSTSLGARLEMWRSAQYIVKDKPFIGIAGGNYPAYIEKYTSQGLVSTQVEQSKQVHNSFVEALISKGLIGLFLLLAVFYYPVYIAWKYRHNNSESYSNFILICTFSTGISLMSLGESMLINKDNGVAHLIFFSAVFFASLIHEGGKVSDI